MFRSSLWIESGLVHLKSHNSISLNGDKILLKAGCLHMIEFLKGGTKLKSITHVSNLAVQPFEIGDAFFRT